MRSHGADYTSYMHCRGIVGTSPGTHGSGEVLRSRQLRHFQPSSRQSSNRQTEQKLQRVTSVHTCPHHHQQLDP